MDRREALKGLAALGLLGIKPQTFLMINMGLRTIYFFCHVLRNL